MHGSREAISTLGGGEKAAMGTEKSPEKVQGSCKRLLRRAMLRGFLEQKQIQESLENLKEKYFLKAIKPGDLY